MKRQHKKSKEERKRDREIVELYHKKLTEDALLPLYKNFQQWKDGELPYYELTEQIHQFHKLNQTIWTKFNYAGWNDDFLLLEAKREMNLVSEQEKRNDFID